MVNSAKEYSKYWSTTKEDPIRIVKSKEKKAIVLLPNKKAWWLKVRTKAEAKRIVLPKRGRDQV